MFARRGEWPAAVAEYDKARAGNPKLPLVNFLYGEALMKERNDWAGAAAAFRAELEIDPNHYESNLLLGTLLREGGQADEALRHLEHAARLRGDDLAVKFSLGAAYLGMGRLEEARRLLEEVVARRFSNSITCSSSTSATGRASGYLRHVGEREVGHQVDAHREDKVFCAVENLLDFAFELDARRHGGGEANAPRPRAG